MKKIVLMFTVFFAFTAMALAQTDAQPAPSADIKKEKRKGKGYDKIAQDLNLSADQKVKMKEIKVSFKGKMQAIRTDKALTKEQKKAQVKDMYAAHEAEIKALLSADQYAKWSEVKAQHKAHGKGKHKEKKGGKADANGKE